MNGSNTQQREHLACMPDTGNLFNDHDDRDYQLSRRFFNRRSEGGSGIVDISVTAAPAFLASKLDVLRYFQGENLYWLTDMEKDSTRWSQSQSPTFKLREASDILYSISRHIQLSYTTLGQDHSTHWQLYGTKSALLCRWSRRGRSSDECSVQHYYKALAAAALLSP